MESSVEVVGCSVGSDGSPRLLVRSSPTALALALPADEVERRWPAQTHRFYRRRHFPSPADAQGQGLTAEGGEERRAEVTAPKGSRGRKEGAEAAKESRRQSSRGGRREGSSQKSAGQGSKETRGKDSVVATGRRTAVKTEPGSEARSALSRSVAALSTLGDLTEGSRRAPVGPASGRKGVQTSAKAGKAKTTVVRKAPTAAKKKNAGGVAEKALEAKLRVLRRCVLDVLRSAQAKRQGPLSARALTGSKILQHLPGHVRNAVSRADLKAVLLRLVKTDGLVKRFAGDPVARILAKYALLSTPEGPDAPSKAAQPAVTRRQRTEKGAQKQARPAKARLPKGAIQSAMRKVLEGAGGGGLKQDTLIRRVHLHLGQGELDNVRRGIPRLIAKGFVRRSADKVIRLCPTGPPTGTGEEGRPQLRQVLQTLLGEAGPAGLGFRALLRRVLPHYARMTPCDVKHLLLQRLAAGIRNGWYSVGEGGSGSEGPFRLGPVRPLSVKAKICEAAAALHRPGGFGWAELVSRVLARHPGQTTENFPHARYVLCRDGRLRPTPGAHPTQGPFTYHPDPAL